MTADFEATYLDAYPAVVRSAWAVCHDVGAAEEHAQEAFARAYARWWTLGRSGYAVAWLHRVAINLAIDDVRRRRRRGVMPTHDPAAAAGSPFEDTLLLVDHLARLPRRQREAVCLRILADLSEEETGRVMGISAGSVKVHKHRGLARLRQALSHSQEGVRHG